VGLVLLRAVVLITLSACTQIYGLEETRTGDTIKRECPAAGTVPTYAPSLIQLVPRACFWFSVDDGNHAVALCKGGILEEGSGANLAPMKITNSAGDSFDRPRLAPEGDLLLVRQLATGGTLNRVSTYQRDGDRWTYLADVIDAPNEFSTVGVPSRGPDRRVIHARPTEYRELAEGADHRWTQVRSFAWSTLGVANGNDASLSPDGLRMTFGKPATTATSMMMYSERASKDEPFGIAQPIDTLPDIGNPGFMTANCERLYFSALSSVFYTNQY
jgi:hypothetical protein